MKPYFLALLLAGCATDQALVSHAPSTEVDKVVAVRCVKPEEIPAIPATAMPSVLAPRIQGTRHRDAISSTRPINASLR